MENKEEFTRLAQVKREADDYRIGLSPEFERIARFFWWIVGGLMLGAIAVTIWVTTINISMIGFEKRITSNEVYRDTAKARFTADDLTHLQTNQSISSIQDILKDWKAKISQVDDMWQQKIRGEGNREAFFREHGYPAPASVEPSPTPHR